jgi:hypothetical protein
LFNPNTLKSVFNLSSPRGRDSWPVTVPRQLPVDADKEYYFNEEMTDFQRDLVMLARALGNVSGAEPETIGDGLEILNTVRKKLNLGYCL